MSTARLYLSSYVRFLLIYIPTSGAHFSLVLSPNMTISYSSLQSVYVSGMCSSSLCKVSHKFRTVINSLKLLFNLYIAPHGCSLLQASALMENLLNNKNIAATESYLSWHNPENPHKKMGAAAKMETQQDGISAVICISFGVDSPYYNEYVDKKQKFSHNTANNPFGRLHLYQQHKGVEKVHWSQFSLPRGQLLNPLKSRLSH